MENNLFYSRGTNNQKDKSKKNKIDFRKKKENTLASLNEVENFLFNYKHFIKYIKLYKLFKN
ncbi:MAG: hypothetical protein HFJ54_02645 [Clostridia bacterium]|nr:hypothetical protein [Clostridia bacterium]